MGCANIAVRTVIPRLQNHDGFEVTSVASRSKEKAAETAAGINPVLGALSAGVVFFTSWGQEQFTEIKDIGPVVAQNVQAYFSQEENIHLLKQMEAYGVNFKQTEEDKPLVVADDAPLVGKSILFTGSLQQMGRKEAQGLAANAGAKNISAVSKKLDILVVGEKAGSKLKKAQDIGTIQIITEQEFLDIIHPAS